VQLKRVVVYVKDLDRMTAFYRDVLEMSVVLKAHGWVEFGSGVALHAIPAWIAEGIEIASPVARVREETPLKVVLEVADVEGEIARLRGLGVVVKERPWGSCDFVDPEGNVFQIAEL
jgi:catechol 2,3-dioxygenase-like lactoylglutathione lyase family enzyme